MKNKTFYDFLELFCVAICVAVIVLGCVYLGSSL